MFVDGIVSEVHKGFMEVLNSRRLIGFGRQTDLLEKHHMTFILLGDT